MNIYGAKGYLTPDDVPEDSQCRIFQIPNSTAWLANFMGALLPLIYSENWQEYGALTPDEAADTALGILWEAYNNSYCTLDVPAPYWETAANADDELPTSAQGWYGELATGAALVAAPGGFLAFDAPDDYHWTEKIADWIIAGFLAIAFTPAAGIKYITFVPRARLAFRRQDWGAFARIFVNGILDREIDTYSPVEDLINVEVDLTGYAANEDGSREVWVANSEDHNAEATPTADGYGIAVVRKRIDEGQVMSFELRQNPDNSCQMQQSIDGGETWTLAFDYSLCIPPAIQTIMDTGINNNTWVNTFAPTITFISQAGYDDTQKDAAYQALCYAVGALAESMASAAYQAKHGDLTAQTLTAIALGVASAILLAFDIMTFGAFTPVALAIASAALAAFTAIDALSADVWVDTDNLQALKCLALSNLTNAPVTPAGFQGAFDNADCLTSDQKAMAEIFAAMLANLATAESLYTNYLNAIGNANAAAQSGVLSASCVCDAATWSHSWQFCGQADSWELVTGTLEANGFTGINAGGWAEIVTIRRTLFIPAGGTLNTLYVYYDSTSTSYVIYKVNGVEQLHVWPPPSNPQGFSSGLGIGGTVEIEFSWILTGIGTVEIQGIIAAGTGVNPVGGCDTNDSPPCWTP